MKKTILFAIAAALPVFAQDAAPAPAAPEAPAAAVQPAGPRHMQRPQLTEEQKAEFRAKMLEKFDANKDGQLDDAEKEAMKAEFKKHHQGRPGMQGHKQHRHHGARPEGRPAPQQPCNCGCNEGKPCECKPEDKAEGKPGMHGSRHEGKPGMHGPRHEGRPQLTEEQKAAFQAKMLEKFDTNKDGQLDDAEKEAAKAEFMKHHQGRPGMHKQPRGERPAAPAPAPAPEA